MRFVPANDLKEGMVLAWDIINPGKTFILKKGIVLTKDYIRHLREKGYLGAYIDDPDSAHIIPEESVSPDKIIDGIKSVENVDIEGIMSVAQGIVTDMEKAEARSQIRQELGIPEENITYIPRYCFMNCKKLSNVTLSKNVAQIYKNAFRGCKSLKTITLPKGLKVINIMCREFLMTRLIGRFINGETVRRKMKF